MTSRILTVSWEISVYYHRAGSPKENSTRSKTFVYTGVLGECDTYHLLYNWSSIPLITDVSPTTGGTVACAGLDHYRKPNIKLNFYHSPKKI